MKMKLTNYVALLLAVLLMNMEKMSAQTSPTNMAWISPGNFLMGNTFSGEGDPSELPLHTVYVSGFYMDKYEVTKALWDEVYQWAITHDYSFNNSGSGKTSTHPVQKINWHDCIKWCNARSEKEGTTPAYYTSSAKIVVYRTGNINVENDWVKWNAGYRLPTEAEWEKAARGGTSGHRFPWSDTDNITHNYANYFSSTNQVYDTSLTREYHPIFVTNGTPYTSPVGYFSANGYGLYDMAGNVFEWCWDSGGSYSSASQIDPRGPTSINDRVARGGSWISDPTYSRTADRALISITTSKGDYIGFRSVLPSTNGWKQAIEAQPAQLAYGIPPTKQLGKDSLVLATHGWTPREFNIFFPSDPNWVDSMSNAVQNYFNTHAINNWQVYGYKWVTNSWTLWPSDALNNAKGEGMNLGISIASQGWSHVHLIAHSAGAEVIQVACKWIKALSTNTIVHCTFLDPFVGFNYAKVSQYGNGADWSDQYFTRDVLTSLTGPYTQSPLNHAYNVDVTQLDPNKVVAQGKFFSTPSGQLEQCYGTLPTHEGAYEVYQNTITGNVTSDYAGFGFPLSEEGGNWSYALANYTCGNMIAQELGTPDPTCTISGNIQLEPRLYINTLPDFTQLPTVQSDTGTIQKHSDYFNLLSGSPAWLATVVTSTNPVNVVTFDANFTSGTGAQGLLTILWDDQVIGSVDERIVNTNYYSFRFPNAAANSSHILGFRLDPFTNIQSMITVTNVALNQVGPSQPFSLFITTNSVNGSLVYQLIGEAGFEYGIQVSTNLINWTTIATLVNTNGAVSFYDQNSANYPQMRFYRGTTSY